MHRQERTVIALPRTVTKTQGQEEQQASFYHRSVPGVSCALGSHEPSFRILPTTRAAQEEEIWGPQKYVTRFVTCYTYYSRVLFILELCIDQTFFSLLRNWSRVEDFHTLAWKHSYLIHNLLPNFIRFSKPVVSILSLLWSQQRFTKASVEGFFPCLALLGKFVGTGPSL